MIPEQGEPHGTTRATTEDALASTNGTDAVEGGKLIELEYEQVLKDLNSEPASFTIPSAEGITMYRGIDGHRNNGKMRELAQSGLRALVKKIERERKAERADAEATPAPQSQSSQSSA